MIKYFKEHFQFNLKSKASNKKFGDCFGLEEIFIYNNNQRQQKQH